MAQQTYCVCHVLSIATIRNKYHFNFILNRTRSGRKLFDRPSQQQHRSTSVSHSYHPAVNSEISYNYLTTTCSLMDWQCVKQQITSEFLVAVDQVHWLSQSARKCRQSHIDRRRRRCDTTSRPQGWWVHQHCRESSEMIACIYIHSHTPIHSPCLTNPTPTNNSAPKRSQKILTGANLQGRISQMTSETI